MHARPTCNTFLDHLRAFVDELRRLHLTVNVQLKRPAFHRERIIPPHHCPICHVSFHKTVDCSHSLLVKRGVQLSDKSSELAARVTTNAHFHTYRRIVLEMFVLLRVLQHIHVIGQNAVDQNGHFTFQDWLLENIVVGEREKWNERFYAASDTWAESTGEQRSHRALKLLCKLVGLTIKFRHACVQVAQPMLLPKLIY